MRGKEKAIPLLSKRRIRIESNRIADSLIPNIPISQKNSILNFCIFFDTILKLI